MTNQRCSRRDFISLAGAGIAGVAGVPGLGVATGTEAQGAGVKPQDADLVVFNAKVYTVDSRAPKVEAFAAKGGRFVAVGSNWAVGWVSCIGPFTIFARRPKMKLFPQLSSHGCRARHAITLPMSTKRMKCRWVVYEHREGEFIPRSRLFTTRAQAQKERDKLKATFTYKKVSLGVGIVKE